MRFLGDDLGQLAGLEALLELLDLVAVSAGVALAELLADGLELLLEVVAALAFVDVLADLGLDAVLELEAVEPNLYLDQAPGSAERVAAAIAARAA